MTVAHIAVASLLLGACLPSWVTIDDFVPPAPVWPDGSNTGPKGVGLAYSELTPAESIDVTTNGAVLDKLDVSGRINVYADDVTIRRSRVRHSGAFGIRVMNDAQNLVVENVEIVGTSTSAAANIGSKNYTCRRCELRGAADGAKAHGFVVIEDSFIHGLRKFDGSHNDGIQTDGSSDPGPITIRRNAIYGPYQNSTAAIIAATNVGYIQSMVVEDNFLFGGSYNLYLVDKGNGYGPPTKSVVRNNVFARYTTGVYRVTGNDTASGAMQVDSRVSVSGNTWDSGLPME